MSGLRAVLSVAAALAVLAFAVDRADAQMQVPTQEKENAARPDTLQPGDAFGEEVSLTEQTIIYFAGSGKWDNAFETIVDAF